MSERCALVVDDDAGFCDMLQSALAPRRLDIVAIAEWPDGLADTTAPALVVVAVEAPAKNGFGACAGIRARWPGVPIVLTTASVPAAELELHQATSSGVDCYLDKRTLTAEDLAAKVEALLGPAPQSVEPAVPAPLDAAAPVEPTEELQPEQAAREAELLEELRNLRWELDATRSAAQSSPFSKDFLRLSEVVAVKEREIVRLKKEIFAREHKIAAGGRTAREASSRASAAAREREAGQAEARRLRLEIQRLTTEAEQALANLSDERLQHDETRRRHSAMLTAHAEVLKQAQDDQLAARGTAEAQLRAEHEQALAALSARWKTKLRRLRRADTHALAILYDQLRDLRLAQQQELGVRDDAYRSLQARAAEDLASVRAGAERQRDELQRLHELSLAEALAGHAAAERRAEELRGAREADAARFREERLQSVAASIAEWEGKLDELRRAHADAVGVLRRHFQEQLSASQAAAEQQATARQAQHEAALRRAAEDVASARMQAARLDQETRQQHEVATLAAETRQAQAIRSLEDRLREQERQAVAAAAAEWAAKLDALRREHADSFDALRELSQEQLAASRASSAAALAARDQAHGEALAQAAQALAASQAQAARREHEAGEHHERELARLQAEHAEALAQLDTRNGADKQRAVAATAAAWDEQLQELRRAHIADVLRQQYQDLITALQTSREQELAKRNAEQRAELQRAADEVAAVRASADAQREQLRHAHEQALADAATAHAEARSLADREQRAAQRAAEAALRDDQARALAVVAAEWERKLEDLRQRHAVALDAQRRQASEQLGTLQISLAQELAKRSDEHRAALTQLQQQSADARAEAARLDHETRQHYELARTSAETEHLGALAALDARLHAALDQAASEHAARSQARLDELQSTHGTAFEALRQEHESRLQALQHEHADVLARKDAEHEAALQRLEQELATTRSRSAHLRQESRQRTEVPAPAVQAEALKTLETRMQEDKERALAAVVAEWKSKMDRLRRGHADSLAALRREHQDHVAAIEGARQQAASKQRPLPFGDPSDKVVPIKAGGERSR